MNGRLFAGFLASLTVAATGCLIVDNDDSDGFGGFSNDGGSGAGVVDGAGGTGAEGGMLNGTGGSATCTTQEDCPAPIFECVGATCDEGLCGEVYLPEGQLCSGTFFCDGVGNCVECLDSSDCGAGELCNEQYTCVSEEPATGVCADNFCQLLAADNACFSCIQDEGASGGSCNVEFNACINDGAQAGCTSCTDYFNGEGSDNFCAGSSVIIQDILDCICTPGVCID
jgi:hypothetical protein